MIDLFCNTHVIQAFDQLRGEMRLTEDATGQVITIGGIPNNAILLKLDVDRPREYKVRSAYLRRGLEFIHKGCDYCLILPDLNRAILFELKSQNPKGYANQFVVSELFIEYCSNLWNKYSCGNSSLTFTRILLSPRFNVQFTKTGKPLRLLKPDRCQNEIEIFTPGFPNRLRLDRLL